MKKFYTIVALAGSVFFCERAFSQTSFKFFTSDTIAHSDTLSLGDIECDGNYIKNLTANALKIDVVRVQNVGGNWTSAFCLDVCYADFIDSVQYSIPANDSVPFIPHFYITSTPDSQCILMKVKKFNNPADVAYQKFCGVTKIGYGAGIHEYANLANVNIYPSPVIAGNDLNMNITNVKSANKNISVLIYNMYGGIVKTVNGLEEGSNMLNLDLATGMYSYCLLSGDVLINAENFPIVK